MYNISDGNNVSVEVDGTTYVGSVVKVHHVYPFEDDDWAEVDAGDIYIYAKCTHCARLE